MAVEHSRPDWLGFSVSTATWATCSVVVGYLAYAAGSGSEGASSFMFWREHYFFKEAFGWLLAGTILGAANSWLRYLRR